MLGPRDLADVGPPGQEGPAVLVVAYHVGSFDARDGLRLDVACTQLEVELLGLGLGNESTESREPLVSVSVQFRHAPGKLQPAVDQPEFPEYLQWFHYCEGMVMPPMNTIVVHTMLLPPDRRDETVLGQAQKLLGRAVAPIESALEGREYLIGNFSAADIMLGHSLFMSNRFGQISDEMPNLKAYLGRVESRPAFQKAIQM